MSCNQFRIFRSAIMLAVLFYCWEIATCLGGLVTSFDEIQFWVGAGSNRAAMVVDWDDTSATAESLVWGYRWDGTSTGAEMLQTVLESDARFFSKQSAAGSSGIALYGLGYDLNDDSEFGITDGTVFNADGIAISGPPDSPPPAATTNDLADLYAEGWFTGFWNYGLSTGGLSSNNPFDGGSWTGSGTGASGRTLSDGDWDSWTFTPTFDFTAFAENSVAAESPFTADFDSDDDTDGADFLAWQRGFGINANATLAQGDADDNGTVDEYDLQIWSTNFGSGPFDSGAAGGALQNAALVVPEPSCLACAVWAFFVSFGLRQTVWRKIS